jgi:hypothetical protein
MNVMIGPTMANPDAFESIDDLRRELRRANETLMQQFSKIAKYDEVGSQVVGALNKLLIMHIQQDDCGIGECLESYLAERPGLREKLEEQLESNRIRQVH